MAPAPIKGALPRIPAEEQTPTVRLLMSMIEHQQALIDRQQQTIRKQQAQIEALNAEVARLKKLPKKPKIRPGTLPKDDEESDHDDTDDPDDCDQDGANRSKGKPTKSRKRKKKPAIHKSRIIKPKNLPAGSRLLGYEDFTIQDLLIQPFNTRPN